MADTGSASSARVRVAPSPQASRAPIESDAGQGIVSTPSEVNAEKESAVEKKETTAVSQQQQQQQFPSLPRRSSCNYEHDAAVYTKLGQEKGVAVPAGFEHTRKQSFSRDDFKHKQYTHLMQTEDEDAGFSSGTN